MASVSAPAYPAGMAAEGYARTDDEIRQVLDLARAGLHRYGYGKQLHPEDLARPWAQAGTWKDNAWLSGVRDLLEWVLGERTDGPLSGHEPGHRATLDDLDEDLADIDDAMDQGKYTPPDPGWPPPQAVEAMNHTLAWLQGEYPIPPVCPEGEGAYGCSHKGYFGGEGVPAAIPR